MIFYYIIFHSVTDSFIFSDKSFRKKTFFAFELVEVSAFILLYRRCFALQGPAALAVAALVALVESDEDFVRDLLRRVLPFVLEGGGDALDGGRF